MDDYSVRESQRCRIFLVEKNTRDMFHDKILLESFPFVEKVRCFSDGAKLLRYMKAVGFHDRSVVCLTPTIIMLAFDGSENAEEIKTLERLKSDPFLKDIPVLVTSHAQDDAMVRALELHADDILSKPLDVGRIRPHVIHGFQWPTREMLML